jgi:hypothetical protein
MTLKTAKSADQVARILLALVAVIFTSGFALPAHADACTAPHDEQTKLYCVEKLAKELEAEPDKFRIDEDPMEAVNRSWREANRFLGEMCDNLGTRPGSDDAAIMETLCAELRAQPAAEPAR